MTSVGFMLATPQIIKRETRGKQAGNLGMGQFDERWRADGDKNPND